MSALQSNFTFKLSFFQLSHSSTSFSMPPIFPTMSLRESRTLWCLVEDDPMPYEVFDIPISDNVSRLKARIKETIECLHDTNAYHLKLFKVKTLVPIGPDSTLAQRLAEMDKTQSCLSALSSEETVEEIFPEPPFTKCLHIVVRRPGIVEQPAESKLTRQDLPRVSRSDTVMALYEKLRLYKFIQVRGTPGTGKSSLCRLLAHHIATHEPTTTVISFLTWSIKGESVPGDWVRRFKLRGWDEENETVFIFDEAQLSYSDEDIWNGFFKSIHEYPNSRAIIFASYGSPTTRIQIEGTPIIIPDYQRVTLRAVRHGDNLPATGLLLTRMEFNDLISVMYPSPQYVFDTSFFDNLFDLTEGHVGAIHDFVRIILDDDSYRQIRSLPNQSYTWTRFLQCVSPRELLEKLRLSSVFARGLPTTNKLQDPNFVAVFEAVLCAGVVTNDDFTHAGEKNGLSECFRGGWLHTDKINDLDDDYGYCFPSPLHHLYIEWKLWGTLPPTPFIVTDLLNFAVTVIHMFSPQVLATGRKFGPGFIQRPPEAQYQDEFYRCCHKYSKGSLITLPKCGTKCGRVDFYIPSKEWGIELLREGDQLEQHSIRFSSTGAYGGTIAFSDYIILDFCAKSPKKPHPNIAKLYHVVFNDNFHTVRILDNNLEEVPGGHALLYSS